MEERIRKPNQNQTPAPSWLPPTSAPSPDLVPPPSASAQTRPGPRSRARIEGKARIEFRVGSGLPQIVGDACTG
jgi:hypothetical protein